MRTFLTLTTCLFGLAALTACAAAQDGKNQGDTIPIGKRAAKIPKSWKSEEPSNKLRKVQIRVPKAKGDDKDGEIAVFHFPGGGSVKDNIERWKGKFDPPKGKKLDQVAKVDEFKVDGVPVAYLDIHGTYKFKFPPFDPNAKITRMPDYRMIGVIFSSDDGPYFITFVAPQKTLAENKGGFDQWLKSLK